MKVTELKEFAAICLDRDTFDAEEYDEICTPLDYPDREYLDILKSIEKAISKSNSIIGFEFEAIRVEIVVKGDATVQLITHRIQALLKISESKALAEKMLNEMDPRKKFDKSMINDGYYPDIKVEWLP